MPTENENQELDLVRFAAGLFQLLKRNIILIFAFVIAGLLSGFFISKTGMKPGQDFFKQDFLLKSVCANEYLYDVSKSLAGKLVSTKDENFTSLRNIEPKLILNSLKESRLIITISAFDSSAIPHILSVFQKELIKHDGLSKELEKQIVIKSAFLKELKLISDSVCKSGNTLTETCFTILEKQTEIETQLQNAALIEISIIDSEPVLISQRRKSNLLLTGLSVIGLLAGLLVSFLSESYLSTKKMIS